MRAYAIEDVRRCADTLPPRKTVETGATHTLEALQNLDGRDVKGGFLTTVEAVNVSIIADMWGDIKAWVFTGTVVESNLSHLPRRDFGMGLADKLDADYVRIVAEHEMTTEIVAFWLPYD